MTIILPDNYHAKSTLINQKISCIDQEEALRQDIRPLRIGILNIMPKAETYEFNLLHPLGRSLLQIQPVWLRLKNHKYSSSSKEHLKNLYLYFDESIEVEPLDALVLTGAPVEEKKYEEVTYWSEIKEILTYARKNISSTLGICWGGLALANMLGIKKKIYKEKLFGIFKGTNLDKSHPITGEFDDFFYCPQSRYAGIEDEIMELEREKGVVNLLAYSKESGYFIFESTDRKYLAHLGHPEYNSHRIIEEVQRAITNNEKNVPPPANFDLDKPKNYWRCHRNEFFTQWIKYVYDKSVASRQNEPVSKIYL